MKTMTATDSPTNSPTNSPTTHGREGEQLLARPAGLLGDLSIDQFSWFAICRSARPLSTCAYCVGFCTFRTYKIPPKLVAGRWLAGWGPGGDAGP